MIIDTIGHVEIKNAATGETMRIPATRHETGIPNNEYNWSYNADLRQGWVVDLGTFEEGELVAEQKADENTEDQDRAR